MSSVTIPRHPYARDEHSGAGNCWCGWAQNTRVHPHEPVGSLVSDGMKCVCGKPWNHSIHSEDEELNRLFNGSALDPEGS